MIGRTRNRRISIRCTSQEFDRLHQVTRRMCVDMTDLLVTAALFLDHRCDSAAMYLGIKAEVLHQEAQARIPTDEKPGSSQAKGRKRHA